MTKFCLQIFSIYLLISLTYSCCGKGKLWTTVDIAIKDTSNNIVEFANVMLKFDGQIGIPLEQDDRMVQTDFEGVAHFDLTSYFLDSETECIVGEVEVILLGVDGTEDSLAGTKTVIIEAFKWNEYEIIVL